MINTTTPTTPSMTPLLLERLQQRQKEILSWLERHEVSNELPLYSSVDIREAGFKAAVVDTNLFPAGFNNLCEHGLADSVGFMRQAVQRRVPDCREILIIAEEHTRNTWYLENLRILEKLIREAGFGVRIATFLEEQPTFCEDNAHPYAELRTATEQIVRIHCFKHILDNVKNGRDHFELIIMNNDLTSGIPAILREANIPIYPSLQAGWHARLKSHHFQHTAELMAEWADILDMDPWLFSCLYNVVSDVDINRETDRQRLAEHAQRLFEQIQTKYDEHRITEKPYIVLKSDSGTYGMAVKSIEHPQDILTLNRKSRNKLYKEKGSRIVERYLLQEGVPTIYNINNNVSEVVIYQIENNLIGGFYRFHTAKSRRDNLNAKGMEFQKMCPHLKKYGDCGVHHDMNIFDIYRVFARIAAIAAHREILQLEANKKI